MGHPSVLLLAGWLVSTPGTENVESPRLTLEVLNERAGRRLLSFEDVIGPEALTSAGRVPWRAALLYALPVVGCEGCDVRLRELQALHDRIVVRGGSVVVVILGAPDRVKEARRQYRDVEISYPIVYDGHELARLRLHLPGPRSTVVIGSDGQPVASFGAIASGLLRAEEALLAALARDER
jgi:hypothetical protein